MMGPSKILTVSYGTFSCTLEGFDDPFSTMRGIAEYFRDLAADDRYFGAEPPTPDAEMLHRIAEREVQHRVEARIDDNGVVLRQVEDAAPARQADPVAQAPAVAPAPATQAQAQPAPLVTPAAAAAPAPTPAPDTESVAAKLARIRAVVADDSGYQEDEQQDAFVSAPISAAFEDVPEAEPADFLDVPAAEPATSDSERAEISDPTAAQDGDDLDSPDAAATAEAEDEAEAVGADDEDPIARIMDSVAAADDAADSPDADEAMEDAAEDTAEADNQDDGLEQADTGTAAIARVVKMRRADFEAAVETGEFEALGEEEIAGESAEEITGEITAEFTGEITEEEDLDGDSETAPSTLSPEDEAELMANLEQVQRKAEADLRAEKEGRALLEKQDIEDSADSVSRILEVTNTEMEETEGTRRRSAIAHLKAAVAATRADKFLSKKREEDDANEMNQYRQDLAKVVRPRRTLESATPKERRTAPLVLVSEQRVDSPQPEPTGDGAVVRPRRVTAGSLALSTADMVSTGAAAQENIFLEAGSFAAFAEEMGARELPDLLEAAAAYSAYIEGNEFFSRPQIMKTVAEMDEDRTYTREESLRSFGLLLRRGKIKKLKRGQFIIAETTRFNPQQRAVGE
jgi:hypothetical protein